MFYIVLLYLYYTICFVKVSQNYIKSWTQIQTTQELKLSNHRKYICSCMFQIRAVGNTACCCRYNSHDLVTSWSCFIRSNIVWSSSSGITINLRRQWQKVSYMCSWFDTNVCCCFKLHQFLCTLYSNDWNLLQVSFWLQIAIESEYYFIALFCVIGKFANWPIQ